MDYLYASTSNRLNKIKLTSGGTQQRGFLYRANGQAYQDVKVGDATYTYAFDSQGRMVTVTKGSTTLATYAYDAMGRRIKRATTGGSAISREYVYLPDGRLLTEADGTGATIREYIWLDDLPIAAVDKAGSTVTLYYVHAGHLGQPLAMTDASKTKVWDAVIEPFGAAQIFTATTPLDLRLPGQQLQAETGLHQNWFRDYDPQLGRYLEPDPIGLDGGPHVYDYVGQDPLTYTDPNGLCGPACLAPLVFPAVGQLLVDGATIAVGLTSLMSMNDDSKSAPKSCPKPPEEQCALQRKVDERQCSQKYSFNSQAFTGCMDTAKTNYDLCRRGRPDIGPWNDVRNDGWAPKKPPTSKRRYKF